MITDRLVEPKLVRKTYQVMKKSIFILGILVMAALAGRSQTFTADSPANCETDSSVIDPFYVSGSHAYRIADTQTIPDMGKDQYAVSWYVDTEEWDFDPQTNYIFSKIEFKKGDTVLATFFDDDGWSYIGVEDSKAKMFKSFRIDSEHTAVVFRGGAYAAGTPILTVFVLSGDEVKLIYNQEYFIEKIEDGKVFLARELYSENPIKCGYLSFLDGHVSIVSNEYPTGKIIF